MSAGFTFLGTALGEARHIEPVLSLGIGTALVAGFALAAQKGFAAAKDPVVPEARMSSRTAMEVFGEFLLWLGDSAMGKENRKYLPFAGAIFLFIFFNNLLGLIPGVLGPTAVFQINAGVAVVVFIMYNYWGVKEVGPKAYLKHMWGPFFLLGFFLFPVELISHLIRPASLTLRLYGNMTGDHLVLGAFTNLTKGIFVPVPVVFYLLGTVVCTIQAFVFTLLTMIYIRLAVAHENHDDEHHHEEHAGHAASH